MHYKWTWLFLCLIVMVILTGCDRIKESDPGDCETVCGMVGAGQL